MNVVRGRALRGLFAGAAAMSILAGVWAISPGATVAEEHAKTPFDAGETQAIERIVRDYLVANPEVMLDVLTALEAHQEAAQKEQQRQAIAELAATLYDDPKSFVAGNPDGDVTIVEFFDYKCGYCKRAVDSLMKVVEEDGNIRLILKEFPILGEESVKASRAAIAALEQDRYLEFHLGLLRSKGSLDDDKLFRIAEESGLDPDRLRTDMNDPEVERVIDRSYELASRIGIDGTPAFIIGDELVPGALSARRLTELVAEARTGCLTC